MKFKIKLYGDYWYKAPRVKVNIDDNTMWEGRVHCHLMWSGAVNQNSPNNTRVIEFEKEISDGTEVKLNIILEGKTNDQTIVRREDGKTLKDQLLYIKSIEIDDIDIGDLVWEAVYSPENRPPQKNTTCLGANGTWCLTFKSPFYVWLLERQIK